MCVRCAAVCDEYLIPFFLSSSSSLKTPTPSSTACSTETPSQESTTDVSQRECLSFTQIYARQADAHSNTPEIHFCFDGIYFFFKKTKKLTSDLPQNLTFNEQLWAYQKYFDSSQVKVKYVLHQRLMSGQRGRVPLRNKIVVRIVSLVTQKR